MRNDMTMKLKRHSLEDAVSRRCVTVAVVTEEENIAIRR